MPNEIPDRRRTEVDSSLHGRTIVGVEPIIPAAPGRSDAAPTPEFLTLNHKRFRIISSLGQPGGEAHLYLAKSTTRRVVVKLYKQERKREKLEVLQQIRAIRKQPLIRIFDAGIESGRLVEVMEHAQGGTLRDLKPFRDGTGLRRIILIIADSIQALHSANVVHCDVKPENILFVDGDRKHPVLADFGIAEQLDSSGRASTEKKGSPLYAAPEAHAVATNMMRVYPASDWYSLGITILDVWNEGTPFPFASELDLMEAKLQGLIVPPKDMPEELRMLVGGLLAPQVADRWGYSEIRQWAKQTHQHETTVEPGTTVVPQRDREVTGVDHPTQKRNGRPATAVIFASLLGVAALMQPRTPFPRHVADINGMQVPLFMLGGALLVWIVQRAERGRVLSTVIAGPIAGAVAGLSAFWLLALATAVPFLIPVCCGVIVLLLPRLAMTPMARTGAGITLGALFLTYVFHTPPVYQLFQALLH